MSVVCYMLVLETRLLGKTSSGGHCDCGSDEWEEWREMMTHSESE